MTAQTKTKLSSAVLEMKFMKKSKEKCLKEADEEKRKIMFESEIPDALIRDDLCIMEPSFVPCLQLLNGRLSFRGMNPEIEKLMQEQEIKDFKKLKQMDGITDKEMAERYSTLVGSMKKKFTTKRKWAAENCNKDECVSNTSEIGNVEKPLKFRKPRDN